MNTHWLMSTQANWYPLDKTFRDEAPCQAYADGETKTEKENSLGCRTDWGTGLCNTWEVTPDSTGCAARSRRPGVSMRLVAMRRGRGWFLFC